MYCLGLANLVIFFQCSWCLDGHIGFHFSFFGVVPGGGVGSIWGWKPLHFKATGWCLEATRSQLVVFSRQPGAFQVQGLLLSGASSSFIWGCFGGGGVPFVVSVYALFAMKGCTHVNLFYIAVIAGKLKR